MRTSPAVISLALSSLLLSGCGGGEQEPTRETTNTPQATGQSPGQPTAQQTTAASPRPTSISETFEAYSAGAAAVTYDEEAVPAGSRVEVNTEAEDGGTAFTLRVSGLQPDRDYGAHVHTKPCGAAPDDSGPHYQNEEDPQQPSTDPKYANPDNEVWLDFTTDADGSAEVDTEVDWVPRQGEANSIVIHAEHTHTEPGHAGQAGDRLACVNVPF
ncbi:superoxide dismutase, Cu-Zn family [Marinactinospora thermotolerans DSM 45154]|uniref:Superoxide dismutase, Cu-Zn family n=1 Tax=Marinactinospora thermotolerans DSM 45154 TaxID=1122192 RepID=A0A1T4N712_9ACTN|nr:superoxide dismutase family protein [Marinactinospora thermotolerans]SJZ74925.1 superoxide dismutase, Cu-Zn family [Marinactinospora thermotolerans DSM 45154]